jgi:CheY-like chemotaxis protein
MKKVLIVDDREENRMVLKNFFNFFGRRSDIELFFAADSPTAFDLATAEKPDLIFLDVHIETRTSGLELAQKIRETLPDTPISIWALTAQAMKGTENEASDEEKCLAAGCDKYFSKPFDQKKMLIEVSKTLDIPIPDRIKMRMGIE